MSWKVNKVVPVGGGFFPSKADHGRWIAASLDQVRFNEDGTVDLAVLFQFEIDEAQCTRLLDLLPSAHRVLRESLRHHGPEKGEKKWREFVDEMVTKFPDRA